MNDNGAKGFCALLAFANGPFRAQHAQVTAVREEETALCLDCRVTFSIRNRSCPKCDGDQSWLIANWNKEPHPVTVRPPRVIMA